MSKADDICNAMDYEETKPLLDYAKSLELKLDDAVQETIELRRVIAAAGITSRLIINKLTYD